MSRSSASRYTPFIVDTFFRRQRLRAFALPLVRRRISMHALIIEDSYLIAAAIQEDLSQVGFTTFDLVARSVQAVAAAKLRCPDLITADERLSDGSGLAAVREICAAKPIPTI